MPLDGHRAGAPRYRERTVKPRTRLDHEERIVNAIRYIIDHLDEGIDLRDLADHVCLSRFHFHRVFQALLGETVGDLVRRLRLERAANRLRTTNTPITELAFEAGYATHEAFIRAFRSAFGYTPSSMRRTLTYEGLLPTPNGVHFDAKLDVRFVRSEPGAPLDVEIRELPARMAVCMAHKGPYFMIGKTFGDLRRWRRENGVNAGLDIGLYYDDPSATPPDELRSDAGAFIADDFLATDPRVHIIDVVGGTYAVFTHVGPYDGISNAWMEMYSRWLPTSGYTFGVGVPFEIYVDDCDDVPWPEVRTDLCIPVKRPAP